MVSLVHRIDEYNCCHPAISVKFILQLISSLLFGSLWSLPQLSDHGFLGLSFLSHNIRISFCRAIALYNKLKKHRTVDYRGAEPFLLQKCVQRPQADVLLIGSWISWHRHNLGMLRKNKTAWSHGLELTDHPMFSPLVSLVRKRFIVSMRTPRISMRTPRPRASCGDSWLNAASAQFSCVTSANEESSDPPSWISLQGNIESTGD